MQRPGEQLGGDALLERVAAIAAELARADTVDETLQRIVDLGSDYLEGCDSASISFVQRRSITTPVYSSRLAYDADQAQYRLDEGPCLEAIAAHETVLIDDVATHGRWPRWNAAVQDLGVRAAVSFRLFVRGDGEDTMGALNMYASAPGAFDRRSLVLGQVFASHAAVVLKAALTEAGLETALLSRDVIGQAKGILMEREHLTAQQAFERLRDLSTRRNVKLRVLAERIAETGDIPG